MTELNDLKIIKSTHNKFFNKNIAYIARISSVDNKKLLQTNIIAYFNTI